MLTRSMGHGALWQILAGVWQTGVRLAGSIFLARLLTPDHFGIVTMTAIVFGIVGQFGTISATGLLAKQDLSHEDLQSGFWLGVGASACMAIVVGLTSPWIAAALGDSRLSDALRAYTLVLMGQAVLCVPLALLDKRLRFGATAMLQSAAATIEISLAIVLAVYVQRDYWALIWATVISTGFLAAACMLTAGWRPAFVMDRTASLRLLRYGGSALGSRFCIFLVQQIDNLATGRFLGSSDLGIYSFGRRLPETLVNRIFGPASGVLLPSLSGLNLSTGAIMDAYVKVARYVAVISCPLFAIMAAVSTPLVALLWGPTWATSAPLIKVFCLWGCIASLGTGAGTILMCVDMPATVFRISFVKLLIASVAIPSAAILTGVLGVAVTMAGLACFTYLYTLLCLRRLQGFSIGRLVVALTPAVVCAALAGGCAFAANIALSQISASTIFLVLLPSLTGLLVYLGTLRLCFPSLWNELVSVTSKLL